MPTSDPINSELGILADMFAFILTHQIPGGSWLSVYGIFADLDAIVDLDAVDLYTEAIETTGLTKPTSSLESKPKTKGCEPMHAISDEAMSNTIDSLKAIYSYNNPMAAFENLQACIIHNTVFSIRGLKGYVQRQQNRRWYGSMPPNNPSVSTTWWRFERHMSSKGEGILSSPLPHKVSIICNKYRPSLLT